MLWAIQGDLDYTANMLGLPHFRSVSGPCTLCRCTSAGALSWTNFSLYAPWVSQCWTHIEWLLWENRSRNPVFTIPGVSGLTVALDWMHAKYLGLDQYMFGSVLFILCHFVMGGSPAENMASCWAFIQQFYKTNRTAYRYRYLNKLSLFVRKNSNFPKLRGKAAEIKDFGPALMALWRQHMRPVKIHQMIHLMLKLNVQLESILTEHKNEIVLPTEAANCFRDAAFSICQLQSQIAQHFIEQSAECGSKLFDVTSKTHFVLHCALLARFINPRVVWCFTGEDFMHKSQVVAQSCVKGHNGAQATSKMCHHFRLGMHLQFRKHEE